MVVLAWLVGFNRRLMQPSSSSTANHLHAHHKNCDDITNARTLAAVSSNKCVNSRVQVSSEGPSALAGTTSTCHRGKNTSFSRSRPVQLLAPNATRDPHPAHAMDRTSYIFLTRKAMCHCPRGRAQELPTLLLCPISISVSSPRSRSSKMNTSYNENHRSLQDCSKADSAAAYSAIDLLTPPKVLLRRLENFCAAVPQLPVDDDVDNRVCTCAPVQQQRSQEAVQAPCKCEKQSCT